MPIDYNKYPSNWKTEIRPAILKRAGQVIDNGKIVTQACCEMCGVKNKDIGYRTKQGKFLSWSEIENALENKGYDYFDKDNELGHCYDKKGNPTKAIRIVLTIMHLDHNIENNSPENLKAACQYCHNNYDTEHRKANRRKTINSKKGLTELF